MASPRNIGDLKGNELAVVLDTAYKEAFAIHSINSEINQIQKAIYGLENVTGVYKRLFIALLLFFTAFQCFPVTLAVSYGVGGRIACFLIEIGVPFVMIKLSRDQAREDALERAGKIKVLKEKLDTLNVRLDKALSERSNMYFFIPQDYRYPYALSTMHGYIINYRESTWRGCANRYEIQIQNERSIELQREILESTRIAEEYARRVAYQWG